MADLAKTGTTDMVRPDFIPKDDTRGTDHITKDDVQIPRLALAQGLTPQVLEGVEGFTVGVMFNSVTNEVYGKGPLDFCVLRGDKPRWVEFNPREEGGGVKDANVPADDPRTQFRRDDVTGKSLPPIATKFYDFIIARLPLTENPFDSIIALSFKSTGLKAARALNALIRMRNAPIFAGKYTVTTSVTKNAKGTFAVYQIANAGWLDRETYGKAEALYEAWKDRIVTVHMEGEADEGADDFNPDELERERA